MQFKFPYKEGDIVEIYKDYQTCNTKIGTARLVKPHKLGRSFILKEMMPEKFQKTYSYQEWYIDWVDNPLNYLSNKPYKIRFLESIGIVNSADDVIEEDDSPDDKVLKDNFTYMITDLNNNTYELTVF